MGLRVSDNYVGYNTIDLAGHNNNTPGIFLYGDRNLLEHNEIKNGQGDCHDLGGKNVVVRYDYCHDINGASGEHIDFIQVTGAGFVPTLVQSLIEHNVEQHCYNDGGNCHFLIIRTGGTPAADGNIARYNYIQNMDGMGFDIGGQSDYVTNTHIYNNTIATETKEASNGSGGLFYSNTGTVGAGVVVNNIFYNTTAQGWSPTLSEVGGDIRLENGNLAFTTGATSFGSPYSGEATYSALQNKDPKFANYPADGTLQTGSPAIGAAAALTTVATGDPGSGTSLVVGDARFFQSGWAGTQGDWIRVGASSTVQISSINYSTNTITLANGVNRTSGNPVCLYKDSSGKVVLNGANPEIGAYPYQSGVVAGGPTPPTNLITSVH